MASAVTRSCKNAALPATLLLVPLLLATLLLSSCAAYHERPLDPATLASAYRARTLHDAAIVDAFATAQRALPTAAWTSDDFWLVAQCCHPELVASRAEVAAAAAAIAEAGQRPNPRLSLLPMRVINSDPAPWILGGSLDLPLDLAGKRGATVAIALAERLRAGALASGRSWQQRHEVRTACCRCWFADADAAVAAAAIEAWRHLVDLVATRVRNGYAAPTDLDLAQTELARATVEAAATAAEGEQARASLAAAIGLPMTALAGVAIAEPRLTASEPGGPGASGQPVPSPSVLGRGDLQAAIADYAISDARLRLAIAAQYPDVTLSPGYELDQSTRKLQLGLSLTLPLWHANGAGIERAELDRTAAAHRFDAMQTAALQAVDAASAAATAAQRTRIATDAWANKLTAQDQRAAAFAEAGLADSLTALAAKSALLGGQRALLRSRRDAALAWIAWETQLGPPESAADAGHGDKDP